jgi:hypothetical protein
MKNQQNVTLIDDHSIFTTKEVRDVNVVSEERKHNRNHSAMAKKYAVSQSA